MIRQSLWVTQKDFPNTTFTHLKVDERLSNCKSWYSLYKLRLAKMGQLLAREVDPFLRCFLRKIAID